MLWHTLLHSRPALAYVGRPSAAHQSSMGLRSPLAGPGPRREETQQSLFDWASTTAAPLLGGAPGGLVRSIRPISPVWDSARQRLVPEHPANQQSVGLTVDDLAMAIEVGAVAGAVKRLLQVVGLKQGQAPKPDCVGSHVTGAFHPAAAASQAGLLSAPLPASLHAAIAASAANQ